MEGLKIIRHDNNAQILIICSSYEPLKNPLNVNTDMKFKNLFVKYIDCLFKPEITHYTTSR